MKVVKADQKASLKGYAKGLYLTLSIRAKKDEYNGGKELVARKGEIFDYHLQYPTNAEVKWHVQYLLHYRYDVVAIRPIREQKGPFMLKVYQTKDSYHNIGYAGKVKEILSYLR